VLPRSLPVVVEIPEPCAEDWDAMPGDERARFCGRCRHQVHDLSVLSASEIDDLLRDESVCVSFLRNEAGEVVADEQRHVATRARAMNSRAAQALAAVALTGTLLGCEVEPEVASPQPPGARPVASDGASVSPHESVPPEASTGTSAMNASPTPNTSQGSGEARLLGKPLMWRTGGKPLPQKAQCDPPYAIASDGTKRYKPECL
jgi:hypothetical protein